MNKQKKEDKILKCFSDLWRDIEIRRTKEEMKLYEEKVLEYVNSNWLKKFWLCLIGENPTPLERYNYQLNKSKLNILTK